MTERRRDSEAIRFKYQDGLVHVFRAWHVGECVTVLCAPRLYQARNCLNQTSDATTCLLCAVL